MKPKQILNKARNLYSYFHRKTICKGHPEILKDIQIKEPLLDVKEIWDIYNNPKECYKFSYINQEIKLFFGKNILYKHLKSILNFESPRIFSANITKIKTLKEEIVKEFGFNNNSKYVLTLGGAVVINKGKVIKNENKNIKLVSIPTSCSNDAFFTNRYKKDENKNTNSTSTALRGLMPDFLIVDTELIKRLITEDLIYAGWGEFLSLITSYNDWRETNKDIIKKEDLELLDKIINKMFNDAKNFFEKEQDINKSLDILMHFLFMKCLLMMIYNDNSIGASSDHMFSYALEARGYCKNMFHGEKVLLGSIISSICYLILKGTNFINNLPKPITDYIINKKCIKEILNENILKELITISISSRPKRKTIFNKVPNNQGFYRRLVEEIKNV